MRVDTIAITSSEQLHGDLTISQNMDIFGRVKVKKKNLLAIFVVLFFSIALAVGAEDDALLKEFNDMKGSQFQTLGNGLGSNPFMREGVARNYDSACLSNQDCYVALKVSIPRNGIYSIKKLIGRNDTLADDFYCEQAIWEFAVDMGGRHAPGEVLCEFYGKPKSGSGIHPELKSTDAGRVCLHLIPQHFSRSDMFKQNELTSSDNVVSIDVKKLNNPELAEFRREWLKFLFLFPYPNLPYGPQPILNKKVEMKKKYENLFALEK
jgi:hypothetical protein